MARLTVEDCLEKIDNRYDLVLLASRRARQLSRSALSLFSDDDEDENAGHVEKPTVLALREIAAGLVTDSNVESLASGYSEDEEAMEVENQLMRGNPPAVSEETTDTEEKREAAPAETAPDEAAPDDQIGSSVAPSDEALDKD